MSDPVSYLYWVSGRPGPGWLVWTLTLITRAITWQQTSCQDDTRASLRKHVVMWLRAPCHLSPAGGLWWAQIVTTGRVLTLTLAQQRWHNCHTAQIISHIPQIYRNQTQFVHYRVSWKDDATEIDLWWARLWRWKYKVGRDDHNKTHFYFQIAQSDQTRYSAERITRICPNVRRNQFIIPQSESSSKNYKFCFALFSVVHFIG